MGQLSDGQRSEVFEQTMGIEGIPVSSFKMAKWSVGSTNMKVTEVWK